ncbi:ArsR/SmtB family transcription factor [Methermicoccus shengliensis]|uniref:Winged helix-turn-helix transcriptional regulator n=1 Tax=Methermicoccus shengliensis TaxID=660064 RepID=A0A832RXN4_9EURY|nr:metalloregulator ArsR/SmtB family transcription factor [Methermicoccus shengliensis]KUK05229.1 MAG: Putative transcription regulator (ArsR family) [Euryarchaeota archaeon 55_53]KUK30848.1 MAG: Putative transcription regulator (ArsR family) [Methanosarcinales archeaon 56_1174]MDI3487816.1 hypothetical protein [Methanosarcinales archaeon]MDN5294537.1 hypothetical protein [Methanosarcinales archaeon]HIH69734.1 winged helix-turn-helix transcriptional regulator [Methermicoccus shengliensis]
MRQDELEGLPYPLTDEELEVLRREAERSLDDKIEMLKVVSDPIRLRILTILRKREVCVCVLVHLLGVRHSTLSYHLRLLKEAGLVDSERKGGFQVYALTPEGRFLIELLVRTF